jgi:phosphatidylethanolamine-binding protein (PEBP) family uncharacterized protein
MGGRARGTSGTTGTLHAAGPPHHYTFILVATDLDPKELPAGLTREEVLAKIVPPAPAMSRAKGTTGLVGLFQKPN